MGRGVELKQFLQEEESRNAIVSVPCGETRGFFLPNPRLGRVFANLRGILQDFWTRLLLPPSRLSITILCPAEFAQRSKDLVHLGAAIRLRAIFISNKRMFADRTGDVRWGRGDVTRDGRFVTNLCSDILAELVVVMV